MNVGTILSRSLPNKNAAYMQYGSLFFVPIYSAFFAYNSGASSYTD